MRKVLVVAAREYKAAVQTKTFLIGLLIMPVLMVGSILVQFLLQGIVDTTERRYAVIDRTPSGRFTALIETAVAEHNKTTSEGGKQVRPNFKVERVAPSAAAAHDVERQRYELSERVRRGELVGFLEIAEAAPAEGASAAGKPARQPVALRYQSNRVMDVQFPQLAETAVAEKVRADVSAATKLTKQDRAVLIKPVELQSKGLSEKGPEGQVREASEQSRVASVAAPMGLMMLMFMVILMSATPLMQGVVEEKMQRIAEVLLGSVPPFELMLGKLIGMAGVSLTMSAVYLSGAFWAANYYGFGEALGPGLLAWFVVYQALAALMFGSLFIAIGAACTDMKETQNLLWPVMLLACLPLFILGNILREPNSPVAVGLSYFPFSTPMLMVTRMAVPPGISWWEPLVGIALVLATTVLCVWAAGRIFRVGILMQGKGARLGEMFRWVFRG
jgi:ABC-2 type transport system permease protein